MLSSSTNSVGSLVEKASSVRTSKVATQKTVTPQEKHERKKLADKKYRDSVRVQDDAKRWEEVAINKKLRAMIAKKEVKKKELAFNKRIRVKVGTG